MFLLVYRGVFHCELSAVSRIAFSLVLAAVMAFSSQVTRAADTPISLNEQAAIDLLLRYSKAVPSVVLTPRISQDLIQQSTQSSGVGTLVLLDFPAGDQPVESNASSDYLRALRAFKQKLLADLDLSELTHVQNELPGLPVLYVNFWGETALQAFANDARVLSLQAIVAKDAAVNSGEEGLLVQVAELASHADNLRAARQAVNANGGGSYGFSPLTGVVSERKPSAPVSGQASQRVLTVTKAGAGHAHLVSSSHSEIDCSSNCPRTSVSLPAGSLVTLSLVLLEGSQLKGWAGVTCQQGNDNSSCTFKLNESAQVNVRVELGNEGQIGQTNLRQQSQAAGLIAARNRRLGAGASHTLFIDAAGALWSWGNNFSGALGLGNSTSQSVPTKVGSATNWAEVSAGGDHSLAIQNDGTLWAWGANATGQLGIGNTTSQNSPVRVGIANNWVAVSAGSGHSLAIQSDGSLWAWGGNFVAQLGLGHSSHQSTPVRVGTASNWAAVAAGANHSLAIQNNGTLWAWGRNYFGELGVGDVNDRSVPTQVGNASNWSAVAADDATSLAIRTDGSVWNWGIYVNPQDTVFIPGSTIYATNPVRVNNDSDWTAVAAGGGSRHALKGNGTLWSWGKDKYVHLPGADVYSGIPVLIGTENTWTHVSGRMGLKNDGSLWSWGANGHGELGLGVRSAGIALGAPTRTVVGSALRVNVVGSGRVVSVPAGIECDGSPYCVVAAARGGTFSLTPVPATGQVFLGWSGSCSGAASGCAVSANEAQAVQAYFSTSTTTQTFAKIAAGKSHSLGIKSDGSLWAWGGNSFNQLGDDTTVSKLTPIQVSNTSDWRSVAASGDSSFALKVNGTLWAWGADSFGQLGLGPFGSASTPKQVGSDTNWSKVAAGPNRTFALKSDGTLWAWGANWGSQLGLGDQLNRYEPTQVGSATNWTEVVTGLGHTLALKSDGTLWSWGDNWYGELGNGTASGPLKSSGVVIPTRIGYDTNWAAVAAGSHLSFAIKTDGTLWGWGLNDLGQVGVGDATPRSTPTRIGNASNWVTVIAGDRRGAALAGDGTLWAWGQNGVGELGDGTAGNARRSPVRIGDGSMWSKLAAGGQHFVALTSNGRLWSWGDNSDGQLGNGGNVYVSTPMTSVPVVSALTVSKTGSGLGSLTSAPAGINCGGICSGNFIAGDRVTLTATPMSGHQFAGWSGACSGSGVCAVTMDAAKSVGANFVNPARKANIAPILMLLLD